MQTQYPILERIKELLAAAEDARRPASYARNFDKSFEASATQQRILAHYEQNLSMLDDDAWRTLKAAAVKRLMRNKQNGWEPLFDILSEAKSYVHLKALGCTDIQMIPPSYDYKTPDLKAMLNGGVLLCEVKTINISDARTIRDPDAASQPGGLLSEGFLRGKLTWTLRAAKAQLDASTLPAARKLIYLVFRPDQSLDAYADDYSVQIRAFLKEAPLEGVEVDIFQFLSIQNAAAPRA